METIHTASDSTLPSGADAAEPPPPTRIRQVLRYAGWSMFFVFWLAFFTLFKLPEDRLKSYIQGSLTAALGSRGITYTSVRSDLSLGIFGLSYQMKDVTLSIPGSETPAKFDSISVSPSLFSLLRGRMAGSFRVDTPGGGRLKGSASVAQTDLDLSVTAKEFDLGQTGLLALLAGIRGSGLIRGDINLDGDPSAPASMSGNLSIELKKITIDAQSLQGFPIPKLQISEGVAELDIKKGKVTVRNLRLGKSDNAGDDIRAQVSGEVTLARQLGSSALNLKVQFKLSDNVKKSLVLLDALLGSGRQADGGYAFQLTGSLESPASSPIK